MKKTLALCLVTLLIAPLATRAQTNEWATQYVTLDDADNGTLNRTSGVAVVDSNRFVALVTRGSADGGNLINYLVGYVDADSVTGRLEPAPTGAGVGAWEFVLDKVEFADAFEIAGGNNNLVYLANNDVNHNILVFELTDTEVANTPYRMETGTEGIWAIEVDNNDYVYVCDASGDDNKTDEVKIYPPVTDASAAWETSHDSAPVTTVDLPPGDYRGLTVSGDGTQLFVSQTSDRKILKYTGSRTTGYTADGSFDFTLDPADRGPDEAGGFIPSVLGLGFMDDPGALFVAVDTLFHGGETGGYQYGRVYVIDPATGTNNDTIDIAQWNFDRNGSFTDASNQGRSGGFTSVMDVDIEAKEGALYLQTWFGWAVEKWLFDGDLGQIVSVEQMSELIPKTFSLRQNYPNPFNPSTTIEFHLQKSGQVSLVVYNLIGQKVATLVDERLAAGAYKAGFDASRFTSGIFFYKLTAGEFTEVKKMILTK